MTQVTDREARRGQSRAAPTRGTRSPSARSRAELQQAQQRRRWTVLAVLAVTLVLVSVDLTNGMKGRSAASEAPAASPSQSHVAAPPPVVPSPSLGPSVSPSLNPSPGLSPSPADSPAAAGVVDKGAGTFTAAPGGTAVVGHGKLLTYRVEVEDGTGQQAASFAVAVDAILDDPRSWTAGGTIAFQRISTGTPGVTIRLASPKTVDRLCYPLTTDGYTSCRVGDSVVINLARWLTAVPDFAGRVAEYRQYAVNHEVGHRLGHGHMACPAAGQLAPVMQQQTLGLKGCRINPWPYVNGQLITGPPVA